MVGVEGGVSKRVRVKLRREFRGEEFKKKLEEIVCWRNKGKKLRGKVREKSPKRS